MLLLRSDFICGKGFGNNYHMKTSLIGNMRVGLIIIKAGENIKELIGNSQTEAEKNGIGAMKLVFQQIVDLIETNIRQRGIGNPNPIKLGRCIKELERIYGIQRGSTSFQGNQYNEVYPKVS